MVLFIGPIVRKIRESLDSSATNHDSHIPKVGPAQHNQLQHPMLQPQLQPQLHPQLHPQPAFYYQYRCDAHYSPKRHRRELRRQARQERRCERDERRHGRGKGHYQPQHYGVVMQSVMQPMMYAHYGDNMRAQGAPRAEDVRTHDLGRGVNHQEEDRYEEAQMAELDGREIQDTREIQARSPEPDMDDLPPPYSAVEQKQKA